MQDSGQKKNKQDEAFNYITPGMRALTGRVEFWALPFSQDWNEFYINKDAWSAPMAGRSQLLWYPSLRDVWNLPQLGDHSHASQGLGHRVPLPGTAGAESPLRCMTPSPGHTWCTPVAGSHNSCNV